MSQRMVDFLARFYYFATRLSFWNGMKWSDRIWGGSRQNGGARKSFVFYQPLVVTEQIKKGSDVPNTH